jgi:two-component system, OmpR family, sensor histidine kinase KdpD
MQGQVKDLVSRYGYSVALASVALSTVIFLFGREFFDKGQWALLYLLLITVVSAVSGFRAAFLAAICSFFVWNFFFLPPYGTFWIDDPKDWLFLFVFLLVGVAMGYQTGQLRKREASALAREKEMTLLNRLTVGMVSEPASLAMVRSLLKEIQSVMNSSSVALYLGEENGILRQVRTDPDQGSGKPVLEACIRWVFENRKILAVPQESLRERMEDPENWMVFEAPSSIVAIANDRDLFIPLTTSARVEGVLYVGEKKEGKGFSLYDLRLLSSVSSMAAGYLERQRLQGAASLAETLKEADRMKSALVSSVSHELKTPLAAITATITGLLEDDVELTRDEIGAGLRSARMNLERLLSSIESLLDLSRLEADAWQPRRDWNELGEILGTVLSKFPGEHIGRFRLVFPEPMPLIKVDFQQWSRLLYHLVENALAYGPQGSEIEIGACVSGQYLRIWVEDSGPGIQDGEKERVFQKFYRGRSSENVPGGTGLGLAVSQEIVHAHGGKISLEDGRTGGARFIIDLPVQFVQEGG